MCEKAQGATSGLEKVVLQLGSTIMVKSAWICIYSKLVLTKQSPIRLGFLFESRVLMTLWPSGLRTSTALHTPFFVGFHQLGIKACQMNS